MARGRFFILPSAILLLVYIRNLVAVGDGARSGLPLPQVNDQDFWAENEAIQLDLINSNHLSSDDSTLDDWTGGLFSTLKSALPVTFEPKVLDFREQPTGMPVLREIKIINPVGSLTLQLTSISGELSEFHTSFFKSKVLVAGESTTFDVVFLARAHGPVEDVLHIQTSLGILDYKVKAVGIANPFKLRPLKGARIPVNATYSPAITMYNPYEASLQINEIYSSCGALHLELFNGQQEGNKALWEIRPYETKTLARLNFHAPIPVNHTAFIRIRTNHTSDPSLVLPVEVEVCEAVGLFLSRELLDFGVLKGGESKSLPLYMLNAGPHQVQLKSITPVPDNPAIHIEYSNTTLKPGSKYIKVAMVTFSADLHSSDSHIDMMLKIWAEDRTSFHQLTIPYEATVLRGSIVYEKSLTLFRVHEPPFHAIIRNVTLSNQFDFPVVIYSAKLSLKALDHYSIISFQSPYVIPPDSKWHSPIRLKFVPTSSDCLFNTSLKLSTNASFFNIPLQCYDGRLEREPVVDALEFGLLSDEDASSKILTIWNPNPVKVSITSVLVGDGSRLPDLSVHLVSLPPLPENNEPVNSLRKRTRKPPFYLNQGHSVVFRVNVTRPKRPGTYAGELLIHSSLGKVLTVPVNYQAVKGVMHVIPESIRFLPTFPFSTSTVTLSVRSTYTQPVKVLSLHITPSNSDGDLHVPITLPHELPAIAPNALTKIGKLTFDPLLLGKEFKYLSAAVQEVTAGDEHSKFAAQRSLKQELEQLETLWDMWQSVIERGAQWFNYSIVLSTEVGSAHGHTVPVEASLEWPLIASTRTVTFPLTIIGNSSYQSLQLINPSGHPLFVEPVLLQQCSQAKLVLKSLSSKFSDIDPTLFQPSVTAFSLTPTDHTNQSEEPAVSSYLIPPYGNMSVRLQFTPDVDQWTHGMVVLRNNLTALEYVHLMGQSSWGYVSVSGVYPVDSITNGRSLLFDFSPSMMEGCIASECGGGRGYESLSLSRIFYIYNAGSSPLTVLKSSVAGWGCEAHGFRVANCEKPIIVYPNRTRKIEITFSPDFTLSRVTSALRLHTSTTGILHFPLLATLPHNLLPICYNSSPHSELELLASYLSVPLWLVALTAMILATIFQVNWHARRLQQNIARMSVTSTPTPHGRDVPLQATGGSKFDLQSISEAAKSTVQNVISERVLVSEKRDQLPPSVCHAQVVADSSVTQTYPVTPYVDTATSPDHLIRHRLKPSTQSDVSSTLASTTGPHDTSFSTLSNTTRHHELLEEPSSVDQSDQESHSSSHQRTVTDQRTGIPQVEITQQLYRHSSGTEDTPAMLSDIKPSSSPTGKSSDTPSSLSTSSVTTQSGSSVQQTRKQSKANKKLNLPSPPSSPSQAPPSPPKKSVATSSSEIPLENTNSPTEPPRNLPVDREKEEKDDQLQRRQSEESIRSGGEHSDVATTPSSCSSTTDHVADQPSPVLEQHQLAEKVEVKVKLKPSYTKEPWTGQTVPVRETGDEIEAAKCEGDVLDTASATSSYSSSSSSSTSVPSKPRSKKKQRAQMKREEKMKRRQREKEEIAMKRLLCSKEISSSDDKVSLTSSSASSTDYLEEDPNGDQVDKICDEEKEDEEEEESSLSPVYIDQQQLIDSTTISKEEQKMFTQPDTVEIDDESVDIGPSESASSVLASVITCSALEQDQLVRNEHEVELDKKMDDKLVRADPEDLPSHSSTFVPVIRLASDAQLVDQDKEDGQVEEKVKQQEEVKNSTVSSKKSKAPVHEKSNEPHHCQDSPLSPSKPASVRKRSQQLQSPKKSHSAPNKDMAASAPSRSKTDKVKLDTTSVKDKVLPKQETQKMMTRPQSLSLSDPNKAAASSEMKVSDVSSAEADGTKGEKSTAATPHELAASLLSKLPVLQRGKVKNDDKPSEGHHDDSRARDAATSHGKKIRGGATDTQQDRNHSSLSLDAQPFIPAHYHAHYPGHPFPPPNFHLRPSYPRGHLMTPPHDVYHMRSYDDLMYQDGLEHRRPPRKRDHQKYSSKPAFTPPPHYYQDYRERHHMPRGFGGVPRRSYEVPQDWGSYHDSASGLDEESWYRMRQTAAARERSQGLPPSSSRPTPLHHRSPIDSPGGHWLGPRSRNIPVDSDPLWDQTGSNYLSSNSGFRDDALSELQDKNKKLQLQLMQAQADKIDAQDRLYGHHLSTQQDASEFSRVQEQRRLYSSLDYAHFSPDNEEGSIRSTHFRRLRELQHDQDNLSLLLETSSASLGRAPGSVRDSSKAVGSSRLLSAASSGQSLEELLGGSDTNPSWMSSASSKEHPSSTSSSADTSWNTIWSLGNPFSSAMSELDEKSPKATSTSISKSSEDSTSQPEDNSNQPSTSSTAATYTGNTYDLFDSSGQNIWSLSSGDSSLFPWSSLSSSKADSDNS